MDGGSMTSEVALHDPFDPGVTLVDDFLHLPYMEHVITDSHFARRDRLGRLVVFVARLRGEGVADVAGLGIDERAALCIDRAGGGRPYPGEQDGFAWLVRPTPAPGRPARGDRKSGGWGTGGAVRVDLGGS